MDRDKLYEAIANRKQNPQHLEEYHGGNGRIDRFLDLVRNEILPCGGTILDIGGSHGDLVQIALREKLFDDGCVIDISAYAVETARQRGIWAERLDIDRDGLTTRPNASADAVVALDFIEHIVDPENFARECSRVLIPGGYVFINTPNISYWKHLESLVCGGTFPHTSGDQEVYHGGHLAFYNEVDMAVIFGQAGFHKFTVHHDPTGEPPPPIWQNLLKVEQFRKSRMLSCPNLLWSAEKR